MNTEQQRKMLECAAKACGFKMWRMLPRGMFQVSSVDNLNESFVGWTDWNPTIDGLDTSEMCARLEIDTRWHMDREAVECIHKQDAWPAYRAFAKDHDNSRLKAWMYAATMCAAKTQGYEE